MKRLTGTTTPTDGLDTNGWDEFYRVWVVPLTQLIVPLAIALVVLVAVSGLTTRFMVRRDTVSWEQPALAFWTVVGYTALLAAAVFLPVYPMCHPFDDGTWLTPVFLCGAALGVALPAAFATQLKVTRDFRVRRDAGTGGLPVETLCVVLLVWAVLVSCFFSWGEHDRLLVAYVALAVLGVTATSIALGQKLKLQVEAQGADGKVDAAATDYVLARLQSLGTKAPELGIARGSELSKLTSEDLSAIPAGAIATAMARILYAISPGLTWRARVTLVDLNRVAVTLTRNGLHINSEVISRKNLGLPELAAGVDGAQLEAEQGRARAQLLTSAAACVLLQLSQAHLKLRTGLCGATHWRSVAFQMIAGERALMVDGETRLELLRASVNADPGYGLGRLDYLIALFEASPRTAENRLRFARLLDELRALSEVDGKAKDGWEVVNMRVMFSQTAIRANYYLMALNNGQPVSDDHERALTAATRSADDLVRSCEAHAADKANEAVGRFTEAMHPAARNLKALVGFLAAGDDPKPDQLAWDASERMPHPSPRLAKNYAATFALLEELDAGRRGSTESLDYLTFALAPGKDRQGLLYDPSFWKLLQDGGWSGRAASDLGLRRVGMLDLPPFAAHSDALSAAGVTTFRQLRLRTADDAHRAVLADYLKASPLVVAHLADIAELAGTHEDFERADVLQVFLAVGITSRADLQRWARADYHGLLRGLRARAERCGLAALPVFTDLERRLSAHRTLRQRLFRS
ncbi:hypothetical protein [Yinghuangia seranimata]|uniref:hypothetical protein n=1 Tax=Yinghuangia seranimata TaxID=408067 RepID=UPI00248BED60|nr:hypothetical protein [Yinghuangia seranimata]MDI2124660.1 hypothetical protein [Yinghuangia seranimata]